MNWKEPDYAAIFALRMENLRKIRERPECLPELKAYYRENPADFISDWGVTFDPRNAERDLPTLIPFVLFQRQREWIAWVIERWRAQRPGLNEKSRDGGVTWLAVGLSCTLCLHHEGVAIGFGSRKTEYVDKIGTMKPILPKARMFMEHLPAEFRGGYVPWRDAPFMRITFPETGSIIAGEGGDDIGRGDRAQPLDAKVLTPMGWRSIGDLRVGDFVIGANGKPTRVLGVYPQGIKDIFKVGFSDGSSTECCDDHLWSITTSAMRKAIKRQARKRRAPVAMVARLADLRGNLRKARKQVEYRYQIPMLAAPAEFAEAELPLDPYLLGAILGDGAIGHIDKISVGFATADDEMVEALSERLPPHHEIVSDGRQYGYRIVDSRGRRGRGHRSEIKVALTDLGLAGTTSADKFIPDIYKFSSASTRLEVLRGLLDTDGWSRARKGAPQICFVSTSRTLISDVRFIVESLGGVATTSIIPGAVRHFPGKRKYECAEAQMLTIVMPAGMNPFRLSRKAMKWKERGKYQPTRSMVSVEPAGRKECVCIRVDAQDHLYVTDHCIVTHNTSIYFFDEAAHHPRQELVEASLSQTTNCRIDISSVRGMNNLFAQKRWGGKIDVFILDWHDDPRKDQAWYDKQCEDLDPVVVAQEIDRDYTASVKGIVIPGAWVRSAIGARERLGIAPSGRHGIAFDVADEGEDKDAVCEAHGTEVLETEDWSGKGGDVFSSTEYVIDLCEEKGITEFRYDADGLGAGVRGDARVINERRVANHAKPIRAIGYRGSEAVHDPEGIVEGTLGTEGDKGRTNQDYFGNRKAQSWWSMRRRFQRTHRWIRYLDTNGKEGAPCAPDDIVSLSRQNPNLMKLVAELSQVTYRQNEVGKIIVEKKPKGMKSPNMADAVVIHYAPMEQEPVAITGDMLAQIARAGAARRRY